MSLALNELRSVLKALARFHADGLAFIKRNNIEKYTFIKEDTGRIKYAQKLIDQFFEPFLIYLEQFDSVRPAVVTLRELQSKGTILEVAFPHLYGKSNPAFLSICHRNLGNGNILLKCLDTCGSAHQVALVDWSHVSLSPFTMDVVHLIFSC
ncbi:uncharacterized protein LOC111713712 [Eurytemora carolleeae]|uniref:uncharacterized protein LOC111713712 n=1 Tax=Eurytemora carolleeae TaxID=1294199 RepID=UPI000C7865AD|nr:uncharacterized protein LOC111713712 [Eurytemora carolleeae]|eukprot:XP_023344416.1 uncharacterized protein LOC111713712 [Eurytemora affinis]